VEALRVGSAERIGGWGNMAFFVSAPRGFFASRTGGLHRVPSLHSGVPREHPIRVPRSHGCFGDLPLVALNTALPTSRRVPLATLAPGTGLKRQLARKKALQAAVEGDGWRRAIAMEKLARYPLDDDQIIPSRFGTAIRAVETYGKERFNIDSQTLWYELVAVAPKQILSEIDSAVASVDFFVASLFLSLVFGLACLVLGAIEQNTSILVLSVPAFALAILCQPLAIRAVDAWSYPFHALINLGRVKLAEGLGLQLPKTIEEEMHMWGLVTKYAYFASRQYGEALNAYRKAPTEQCPEKRVEEEAENGGTEIDGDMP
jgi:hypothetical protein